MIAAALAGNAPVIVTGDRDLLNGEQLTEWLAERGIEVIRRVVVFPLLAGAMIWAGPSGRVAAARC